MIHFAGRVHAQRSVAWSADHGCDLCPRPYRERAEPAGTHSQLRLFPATPPAKALQPVSSRCHGHVTGQVDVLLGNRWSRSSAGGLPRPT